MIHEAQPTMQASISDAVDDCFARNVRKVTLVAGCTCGEEFITDSEVPVNTSQEDMEALSKKLYTMAKDQVLVHVQESNDGI